MAAPRSLTREKILEFLAPDESAADVLLRLRTEQLHTGLNFLDQLVTLRPGSLLEIAGPAGSGKTSMLLQIAVACVLAGVEVAAAGLPAPALGPRCHVLLVDMDGKLDPLHLVQVVHAQRAARFPDVHNAVAAARLRVQEGAFREAPGTAALLAAWDQIERDCLSRIHVLRVHSSLELLAGLLAVVPQLQAWKDAGEGCCALLLDGVGAFTHADRAARACPYHASPPSIAPGSPPRAAAPGHGARQGNDSWDAHSLAVVGPHPAAQAPVHLADVGNQPLMTLPKVHAALSGLLHKLGQQLRLCCIATKYTQVTLKEAGAHGMGPDLSATEYLPAAWTQHVTHRLLLTQPMALPDWSTLVKAQLWQGAVPGPLVDIRIQAHTMAGAWGGY